MQVSLALSTGTVVLSTVKHMVATDLHQAPSGSFVKKDNVHAHSDIESSGTLYVNSPSPSFLQVSCKGFTGTVALSTVRHLMATDLHQAPSGSFVEKDKVQAYSDIEHSETHTGN